MSQFRVGPLEVVVVVVLAIGLGMAMTMNMAHSNILIGAVTGAALLVAAFLSTQFSLYLLICSMLLGPEFVFGGGGITDATVGRGVTFRFDDILLAIMGLVWLIKAAINKEEAPLKYTPLNGRVMLYAAACAVATLAGVIAGRVKPLNGFFFNLKYFEYFFLYFMVVNAVRTKKQAQGLVIAALVTCFLVSLYAIAQIPSGARASAPFEGEEGEPNTLGGYLVFMLSVVMGLLLIPKAVSRKWPLIILVVVGVLALMATLSRTSFLAAAVVILVIVIYTSYRKPLIFALVLAIAATSPLWTPDMVKKRILFTVTQPTERGQVQVGKLKVDTSTSDRLRSWQRSFEWWTKTPIWGGGITGAPFMDAMYPRVLVETGLIGSVAFGALLWGVYRVGMRTYKEAQDPTVHGLALGFLFGFLGMLVHAIGANTFIIVRIMEPFWLIAAVLVRAPALAEEEQAIAESDMQVQSLAKGPSTGRAGLVGLRTP